VNEKVKKIWGKIDYVIVEVVDNLSPIIMMVFWDWQGYTEKKVKGIR